MMEIPIIYDPIYGIQYIINSTSDVDTKFYKIYLSIIIRFVLVFENRESVDTDRKSRFQN